MKNVTLKLDDNLLKKARTIAVEEDASLSQWVTNLIKIEVIRKTKYQKAMHRILSLMHKGLNLGGKPLTRDAAHERG